MIKNIVGYIDSEPQEIRGGVSSAPNIALLFLAWLVRFDIVVVLVALTITFSPVLMIMAIPLIFILGSFVFLKGVFTNSNEDVFNMVFIFPFKFVWSMIIWFWRISDSIVSLFIELIPNNNQLTEQFRLEDSGSKSNARIDVIINGKLRRHLVQGDPVSISVWELPGRPYILHSIRFKDGSTDYPRGNSLWPSFVLLGTVVVANIIGLPLLYTFVLATLTQIIGPLPQRIQ